MLQKAVTRSDLKEDEIVAVEVGGKQIALYLVNGEPLATPDLCTHEECLLSEDGVVEGEEVECACHGSRFVIRTGEVTAPPAMEPLEVYRVEVQGDDIMVDV